MFLPVLLGTNTTGLAVVLPADAAPITFAAGAKMATTLLVAAGIPVTEALAAGDALEESVTAVLEPLLAARDAGATPAGVCTSVIPPCSTKAGAGVETAAWEGPLPSTVGEEEAAVEGGSSWVRGAWAAGAG